MAAYVVVAGYVTVETAVPGGRASVDIPRGVVLPGDVPAEQVTAELRAGRITPLAVVSESAGTPAELMPPPRHGKGSGKDAWAAYAAGLGCEVPEGATRDQVIEALAAAGVPVE